MNIEDMSADDIAGYLANKVLGPPKLPAPVQLSDDLAKRGADLTRLINGVDVVVGVLNGTVQRANQDFWDRVQAYHAIDTERFLWSVEDGCLVPTDRPGPAVAAVLGDGTRTAGQPAA